MQDFSSILNHIASRITLNEEDKELFISVLRMKEVKRKQFVEQPGYVSKYRTYVVNGALRAFFTGIDGHEHTISLAVDDWMIGDPGSFILQEPATLYIEAIEDSTLIQWSYESEQLLLEKIPQFAMVMMQRSQQIAVMIQRRLISHLSLSAEERYEEFAQNKGRKSLITAMGISAEQLFSAIPLEGRAGTAEELAEMIAFLVSDRASYITGHNHFVSGGWGELA